MEDEINELNIFNNTESSTITLLINIITLVIGLTIGIVFGYLIFKQYDYKGPDSNIIINEIYTEPNGKKYKWVPKVCICPISYSMDKLKDPNYIDLGH